MLYFGILWYLWDVIKLNLLWQQTMFAKAIQWLIEWTQNLMIKMDINYIAYIIMYILAQVCSWRVSVAKCDKLICETSQQEVKSQSCCAEMHPVM